MAARQRMPTPAVPGERNRQWLLEKRPDGPVGPANFRRAESDVPVPGPGQMLVRNLWYSFEPTQRLLMAYYDPGEGDSSGVALGGVMTSIAVSEVLTSHLAGFVPGDLVHGHTGWEDYSVVTGKGFLPTYKLPDGMPPNLALGALGLTGLVAYFGVVEVGRAQAGETFVISGGAGGVGSVAVQLAKILGLRVVAVAGTREKLDWLRDDARVDGVINYRTEDVATRLGELCPDGIDLFFDNDGGAVLDAALDRLRQRGRVVLCGATSRYAADPRPPGPMNYLQLVMINGRMEGLLGRDYVPRREEAWAAMRPWIASGQLRPKEDVLQGFDRLPEGIGRLYDGANVGKQLLRLRDPSVVPA
jgi:NADPH-dependent curcumin reductase